MRVIKRLGVESALGNWRPGTPASGAEVPEFVGCRNIAWEAAGHTDDGHALWGIPGDFRFGDGGGLSDWCPSAGGRLETHLE